MELRQVNNNLKLYLLGPKCEFVSKRRGDLEMKRGELLLLEELHRELPQRVHAEHRDAEILAPPPELQLCSLGRANSTFGITFDHTGLSIRNPVKSKAIKNFQNCTSRNNTLEFRLLLITPY